LKFNQKFVQFFAVMLVVSSILAGCSKKSGDMTSVEVNVSVETKTITSERIEEYKNISSTVLADNEVKVIPKAGGTVKKVYVKLGDEVKTGDILFEIDGSVLALQVEAAQAAIGSSKAALNSAKASFELSTGSTMENQISQLRTAVETQEMKYNDSVKNLEKYKLLYEDSVISQQDYDNMKLSVDTAQTQLDYAKNSLRIAEENTSKETENMSQASIDQAEAVVKQSQASLKSAQQQLSYTSVVAEIDGIISACNITEGSIASQSSPAMTIVSMDNAKISFNVSDDYINKIKIGAKAYINIEVASEEIFEGTVANIAPAADSVTMLYPVEIYIENDNHLIKPGMFASLKLVLDEKENVMTVPLNAVLEKSGEKYVFTVDEQNLAHKVIVKTGVHNDENIEITEGINLGNKIVVVGQDFISDETTVNITANN